MFERFTKAARAVVADAHAEATAAGARRIGRVHLLLALADGVPGPGLDADALRADLADAAGGLDPGALAAIGIDLEEVRRRVEAAFGPGALTGRRRGHLPFSRAAKRSLELALREAVAAGDRGIGAEHVLLGLMRDPGPAVTEALRRQGQTPEAVRAATLTARRRAA